MVPHSDDDDLYVVFVQMLRLLDQLPVIVASESARPVRHQDQHVGGVQAVAMFLYRVEQSTSNNRESLNRTCKPAIIDL
jgi:hypothetical protein